MQPRSSLFHTVGEGFQPSACRAGCPQPAGDVLYEFLIKCFNSILYKEFDETRICKNLQILLCIGTAF